MAISKIADRFKDAQWYKDKEGNHRNFDIIIGGAGSIGSIVCFLLARINYKIHIYDFDYISQSNIGSGQMYRRESIGNSKVEECVKIAKEFSDNTTIIPHGKYDEDSPSGNICFSGFDNMKARRLMFEKWLAFQLAKTPEYRAENPQEVNIFIDGRMDSESWEIFAITNPRQAEHYDKIHLFDDSRVPERMCTFASTTHTVMGLAADMVAIFTNHIVNKTNEFGINMREVPYHIVKTIPDFGYKIENIPNEKTFYNNMKELLK